MRQVIEYAPFLRFPYSSFHSIDNVSFLLDNKFNKTSLINFFYRLSGKWEEKLTTEQKEACEATIKYDTALKEMETIEFKLKQIQEELDTLKK